MKFFLMGLILLVVSMFTFIIQRMDIGSGTYMQDTIPPIIRILGNEVDTAYLYSNYKDEGAEVFDDLDGVRSCNDAILVTDVSQTLDLWLPGTYFIYYNAYDTLGVPLPTATRTVHVIENSTTFLNGNYNVTCTCSVSTASVKNASITTGQYTVAITSSNQKNTFELSALEVGSEILVPNMSLEGNTMYVDYWSPNLDYINERAASGTLSPAKNSFTLQTVAHPYHPLVTYRCKNVFTKQLVIK